MYIHIVRNEWYMPKNISDDIIILSYLYMIILYLVQDYHVPGQ